MTKTKMKEDCTNNQLIPNPLLFPKRRGWKKHMECPLYSQERGVGGEFEDRDYDFSLILTLYPIPSTLAPVSVIGIWNLEFIWNLVLGILLSYFCLFYGGCKYNELRNQDRLGTGPGF